MSQDHSRQSIQNQADSLDLLKSLLVPTLEDLSDLETVERELMGLLMEVGRGVMGALLEQRCVEECVEEGGVTWRSVVRSTKRLMTSFGRIAIDRPLFRCERNGPTRCFLSESIGVVRDMWTPRAAKLAAIATTELTLARSEELLAEFGGMAPSAASFQRLTKHLSGLWEESRASYEHSISEATEIPEEARAVAISLDGVMVNMVGSDRAQKSARAKAQGRKPPKGTAGYREASVGVVTFYDGAGERLSSRRVARMPEHGKRATKAWLEAELKRIRDRRPDLTVVAIADGAPNNWTFLRELEADHEVVDYYHSASHVHRYVQLCMKSEAEAAQEAGRELTRILLERPNGAKRAFAELEKLRAKAGRGPKWGRKTYTTKRSKRPTYLDLHCERMNYAELRERNLPIGSGVTEGTCRHVVVDRLRRSGMRWSSSGGQAILTLRALRVSGDFESAWPLLRAANDRRLRSA